MEKSREDLLRRVIVRPASQIGLDDEPPPYLDQYTRSEEKSSYGPVDDEILTELRQVSKLLTQITESLARLEGICMRIATSQSSFENIQTVYPAVWGEKQEQARQLLVDLLAENPEGVNVKRIRAEAAIRGISMRTMKEAKRSLGLKSEKYGTSWLWKWPNS